MNKSEQNSQLHHIIHVLDLTSLNFNYKLTIDLFKFNSTVNNDMISVKIYLMLNH